MTTLALEVRKENRIAILTRSRKYHRCAVCQDYINKGERYYSITVGGSGLGGIKFPQRTHTYCLDEFFKRVRRAKEF